MHCKFKIPLSCANHRRLDYCWPGIVLADEKAGTGRADEGRFTAGFRVGPNFTTQDGGVSTAGPALNFQGLYGLNDWIRVGMMLEWKRHGLDGRDGTLNTISLSRRLWNPPVACRPNRAISHDRYRCECKYQGCRRHICLASRWWGRLSPNRTNIERAPRTDVERADRLETEPAGSELSTIGLLFGVRHTY